MTVKKAGLWIKQNWIYYLIGLTIIVGMKYFYSRAGTGELKWILAPTARWVRILSGISFTYESRIGYVNHDLYFIIAASCSGVQFMIITIATLIFSFVHRMESKGKAAGWIVLSIGGAYVSTIMVNGLRIIISIGLPLVLSHSPLYRQQAISGQITPETLHTVIGVAVYFTSLLLIHRAAGYVSQRMAGGREYSAADNDRTHLPGYMVPAFWYVLIALGIPFLNHAYRNNAENFIGYASLILLVCMAVLIICHLISVIKRHL